MQFLALKFSIRNEKVRRDLSLTEISLISQRFGGKPSVDSNIDLNYGYVLKLLAY